MPKRKNNTTDTLLDDLEPGMQVTYAVTGEEAVYLGPQWNGSVRIKMVTDGRVKQTKAHYLIVGWEE
jgi:hypothetical protein